MKICLGCMEHYEDEFNVCPHCGYVEGTKVDNPLHISPGNVMQGENGSYVIGKVLGFGSFGVTYIAWDNVLERKVAIKEYMPSEYSTRSSGQTMVEITPEKRELFSKGMEKFIEEARKLAKFESEEGIVRIFDHFYQNDTAYIVMEHLDGITLTEYLEKNGKIKPQMAVDMIMPVMESLKKVNDMGIIHRDIAPDNIMITRDGNIKLIDFGAARFASSSSSKSLTVMVKQGYSPEEQYRRRGDQGAHTDVYSLAATLYKMITGVTPPDALKRRAALENEKKNILVPIRKHDRKISRITENAIYNAMNIRIEDRTQNIGQFIEELTADKPAKLRDQSIPLVDRLRWKPWQLITAGISAVTVIVLTILLATGIIHFDNMYQKEFVMPEGMTRVPQLVNKELPEGEKLLGDAELLYKIMGKEPYNAIPKDKIYKQSINSGMLTDVNTVVEIWISGGMEMYDVPNVIGLMEDKALGELEAANIPVEVLYSYNNSPKGSVIEQSVEGGSKISKGTVLQITISKGLDPDIEFVEESVEIPDFTNMTYEEALNISADMNIQIAVEGYEFSEEYEKDKIARQTIPAGTIINNTEIVYLVISKGIEQYEVPDVVFVTETKAKEMLTAIKLIVNVEYDTHPNIAEGLVISQSIENGTVVKPETEITIVVSTGQGTFKIPNVTGKNESKAKKELQGLGLRVAISYEYSDEVASGNVISQSIPEGTDVKSGDTVKLIVSTGEELFEVADVYNEKEASAKKKLEKNFTVSVTQAYSDDVAEGCVMSQSLAAGTKYKKDTQIAIVVSKGKEPFKVTFQGNGGEVSTETITAYYNVKYSELPNGNKKGYSFDGWYTSVTGGTKVTESSVHGVRGDITLYAQWKPKTYTVTFDGNGGDSKGEITVTYNSTYGSLPTNSRENYAFDGWYTESEGGSQITANSKVTITEDQTLYAHWTRGKLTVTFNANGGSVSEIQSTYAQGDKYEELPTPTRTNYVFDGWFTERTEGTLITTETKVTEVGNQTLYAHWTRETLNVSFDACGGSVSPSNKECNKGDTYGSLPTPTLTNYIFNGWYTEKSGGTKVTASTIVNASGNQTLYAQWTRETLKVTFNANGGSVSPSTYTFDKGGTYNTLPTPTRTNYTFNGWFTASSGGTQVSTSTTVTTSGNQTLYAQWTRETLKVTFNANGGSVSTSNKTCNKGDTYGSLPKPTRDYYTFDGWYTSISGGTKVTSSTSVSMSGNQTLYARWNENSWSDWTTKLPSNVNSNEYEIKYRYRDLMYTGWVTQGWTAEPSPNSLTYRITGNTKNGEATAWKTQYNYYSWYATYDDGSEYWTYCMYNNGRTAKTFEKIWTGWLDAEITKTETTWSTHRWNCGDDCPANSHPSEDWRTYIYNNDRYYHYITRTVEIAWVTLYEYQTRDPYWGPWKEISSVVVPNSERQVEYMYRKK